MVELLYKTQRAKRAKRAKLTRLIGLAMVGKIVRANPICILFREGS